MRSPPRVGISRLLRHADDVAGAIFYPLAPGGGGHRNGEGGGGMNHGQVIGATDRIAGEAVSRPVTFGEVYSTLFRHLGIDPQRLQSAGFEG